MWVGLQLSGLAKGTVCQQCQRQNGKSMKAMYCFFCSEWEHAGCRSLHADLFLAIKQLDSNSQLFKYECTSCLKRNVSKLLLRLRDSVANQGPTMAPRSDGQLNQSRALIQEPAIDMLLLTERERKQRDETRFNFVVAGLPENDGCTNIEKVVRLCEDHNLGARLTKTKILFVSVKLPLEENRNYYWSN